MNKCDLPSADLGDIEGMDHVRVSAITGEGLDELSRRLASKLDVEPTRDRPDITNVRHIALLGEACEALGRARRSLAEHSDALSEEFVLADLQGARTALEEITGKRVSEDLLAAIFSRFCIGK